MFSWHRESYLLYKCHYKPKVDWLANNDTSAFRLVPVSLYLSV